MYAGRPQHDFRVTRRVIRCSRCHSKPSCIARNDIISYDAEGISHSSITAGSDSGGGHGNALYDGVHGESEARQRWWREGQQPRGRARLGGAGGPQVDPELTLG